MVDFDIKENELQSAVRKLDALGKAVTRRQRKAMLRKGAKLMRDAARSNIKDAKKTVYRYSTPKIDGKQRAPKGLGRKVMPGYSPGNLRRAINVKSLRKSADLFVGPTRNKRIDGYYAHFVEFGTRYAKGVGYMRKAYNATKGQVADQIIKDAKALFDRTIKKLKS